MVVTLVKNIFNIEGGSRMDNFDDSLMTPNQLRTSC